MRELFLQIIYGRTQSAFSDQGLEIGAGMEDLGKGLCSQVGTMYSTELKGPRYLNTAEGYITKQALDANGEIIGYEYIATGKLLEAIKNGVDPREALAQNTKTYGRFNEAVKVIDPRKE